MLLPSSLLISFLRLLRATMLIRGCIVRVKQVILVLAIFA
jgi:hypothetical protein